MYFAFIRASIFFFDSTQSRNGVAYLMNRAIMKRKYLKCVNLKSG